MNTQIDRNSLGGFDRQSTAGPAVALRLQPVPRPRYWRTLMVVGLILSIAAASRLSAQAASTGEPKHSPAFIEKMKHWQNEMSEKFSETFNALRKEDKSGDKSIAMVSVDLREKSDSYILRVHLPDRNVDQVEVTLENNSLSIMAPAEGKAALYQQTLTLTGLAAGAKPVIERRKADNLMIVTIPKAAAAPAEDKEPPTAESPVESWDRDVLDRMDRMHQEMNRIFKNAFQDFRSMPEHMGIFDEPRFGSSFVVQDEGDQYVVRAYLPERDLKDLKVNVQGKVLKIEAQAETTGERNETGAVSSYKAAYSQTLTLPGPVLSEKMKVDRKDGMVVVTLPKATAIR
ncbi:MAG: hypothetical protein RLZZ214_1648 [Verrucomicrobiota bacterium]|jgi:HSP20 family protein